MIAETVRAAMESKRSGRLPLPSGRESAFERLCVVRLLDVLSGRLCQVHLFDDGDLLALPSQNRRPHGSERGPGSAAGAGSSRLEEERYTT